jgi:hypothetical protein
MKPDFCKAPELESGEQCRREEGVVPLIEAATSGYARRASPSGCGSRKADEGGTEMELQCIYRGLDVAHLQRN